MLGTISTPPVVRRFLRQGGGAAAAEFAMVILFLTILLITAIEAGRLFHAYQASDKAVRNAARYLAQQPIGCPAVGVNNGTVATDQMRIAELLILTGTVDHTQIVPGTLGNLGDPVPTADLTTGYWNADTTGSAIRFEIDCLSKTSAAIEGGEFFGAYAARDFVPVVRVEADVPFDFVLDLWGFTGFSVDHRQVGIE